MNALEEKIGDPVGNDEWGDRKPEYGLGGQCGDEE